MYVRPFPLYQSKSPPAPHASKRYIHTHTQSHTQHPIDFQFNLKRIKNLTDQRTRREEKEVGLDPWNQLNYSGIERVYCVSGIVGRQLDY